MAACGKAVVAAHCDLPPAVHKATEADMNIVANAKQAALPSLPPPGFADAQADGISSCVKG